MTALEHRWTGLLAMSLLLILVPRHTHPQNARAAPPASPLATAARDGQHDFDFQIGAWKSHVSKLLHPLTGSKTWEEYDGTTVVSRVWNGRANLVELEANGPSGHLEALSLRLYNPEAHQWSLNFSNSRLGTLSQPTIGEFKNGRGEFYDQETLNGRAILVRFIISQTTAESCRFEQAFSADGGRSWEVNWIATDTRDRKLMNRTKDGAERLSASASSGTGSGPARDARQTRRAFLAL
jgi:hypothetical protein